MQPVAIIATVPKPNSSPPSAAEMRTSLPLRMPPSTRNVTRSRSSFITSLLGHAVPPADVTAAIETADQHYRGRGENRKVPSAHKPKVTQSSASQGSQRGWQTWWASASPISMGPPACLMEDRGEAPIVDELSQILNGVDIMVGGG
ncbi:MAG: hypothetical protein FRX49_06796 [Trebouxia sp. A1-2]|nr:MAG: hypothetical protein FRX49_06796 [Trebouxia sp. A1-2]